MIADPPIGEDDLNAFVDGRLAPERHALVGRFLADNSSLGERVAADIAARNGLRESLQFKAAEPIPARLRIANLAVERRRAPRRWLQVAAAIVLVALGGIGGWFAHASGEVAVSLSDLLLFDLFQGRGLRQFPRFRRVERRPLLAAQRVAREHNEMVGDKGHAENVLDSAVH